MKKQLASIFFMVLFMLPSAWAETKPEDALKQRVETLMQAKVDGKWDVVYTLYDAAFRETIAKEKFANQPKNVMFKAFKIEKINILDSAKDAEVELKVDFSAQGFDFKDAPEKQLWVLEDNQWFQKVKPKANPMK